jgi:hypothetical protein
MDTQRHPDDHVLDVDELARARKRLMDPEFRAQYAKKQERMASLACIAYVFCCPCIAVKRMLFG